MPYGPDFKIKKIECRNHLLRNYMTKLSALSKRTEYPVIIRNFIIKNILRFRSDIRKAVRYYLSTDLTLHQKTTGELKKYIKFYEYFGITKCIHTQIYNIYKTKTI
jgi:hypothetical protein